MAIHSFQRKEKKYLITRTQMRSLLSVIHEHMDPDKYCRNGHRYLIRNLYYDTDDNQLIRLSTLKPYYKEKLRVRKYGSYHDERDEYFLEMKKKIGGVVSKRRVKMTKEELDDFLQAGTIPPRDSFIERQVLQEIAYFRQYRQIHPVVFIAYERLAFFDRDDPHFRVTFDQNIYARRYHLDMDEEAEGLPLLQEDQFLMEVKISGSMPIWFAQALSANHIYPTSFSKYGTEYKKVVRTLLKGDYTYVD